MRRFALAAAAVLLSAAATIEAASARGPRSARSAAAPAEVHELLAAEAEGLVTVRYIPNDSRSAQVMVTNRSGRPLTLRLPEAFAGVPVLAQMGGMGGGGGGQAGFGAGGIGAPAQTTGGAGPQNAGMNIGGQQGGGMFSVPPEKTRVVRVTTVCLEHGRPEPAPKKPYKLVPLDSFSNDPRLEELMRCIGRGEVTQRVAQAAAWHIASGLTWEQLAAEKIDHAGGVPDEPFFAPAELKAAHELVAVVTRRAGEPQAAGSSAGR